MFRILSKSAIVLIASPAFAQEPQDRFFLRAGPAFATFDATAEVKVAGELVRGGEASVKNNTGLAIEGGWFLTPDWSISLTIGVPPKARISGEGTLASAGALGSARYAPSALNVQYNVPTTGRFRPYIGAGLNYTLVYDVHGSAIRDLRVSNGYGPVVQAGAEYRVSRHMAAFIDVKKIWVAVDARGFVDTPAGPQAATARLALDPVIASAGVSWHF
jgi:outer membrane protein